MRQTILFVVTISFIILLQSCATLKNYPKVLDTLLPEASFIFKGKILVLHSSTIDEDSVDNTGVVQVIQIINAPENLKDAGTQQLTVRFADISKMKEGEERLFFTTPYWYGENIGVDEKGSYKKGEQLYDNGARLSQFIDQAKNNKLDSQLRSNLKIAPLVVTGKVIKINELSQQNKRRTEHDPQWQEAEIEVSEVLKGSAGGSRVRIIYAASKDVMFYRSPKFNIGDEGIFIIQKTDGTIPKFITSDKMIAEPENFIRGKERISKIKSLLK